MDSQSLLHAAGLAMCDQELTGSSEKDVNGETSHNSYGSHGDQLDGHHKIPCPWACGSPEFASDEDLYAHVRLSGDTVACPNLSRMVWDATTPELIHNLSQMMGMETSSGAESSASKRIDPHGRFLYFISGFLTARGIALQTPMFTLPYPFSKFMWEWATTDKPDSQTVVNSFQINPA
ncbi:uncharacterized protein LOC129588482 [Paramacrobiotus metropolitanus]|uniref:uncharacterized protein LOC129588482 n=1 Tax=Paramacrobiotus metropolitanus TaxID=2943436 RepID=UPI002446241F|nr:uncharacterized protein LOC129588482 [Paramacrobiotus metropolitanus]